MHLTILESIFAFSFVGLEKIAQLDDLSLQKVSMLMSIQIGCISTHYSYIGLHNF